ncbi:MAG TPA: SAM-dependent methyltransferase [Stellaceae bacterium]|nr:SAM-dependent methyltransferase [Stellaceae bacterium]
MAASRLLVMPLPISLPDAQPFPIFVSLNGLPVLVVGEDGEAAGKLRLAARTGASLRVVAVNPDAHLLEAIADCGAELRRRAFEFADLDDVRLCFVALRDEDACAAVVTAARDRGVLVNAVDKPALCDFIVPAIIDRPPITVAISTGGTAPILARELRRRIEAMIPPAYGDLARFLHGWRARVTAALADALARRRFWESALESPAAEHMLAGDARGAEAAMAAHLDASARGNTLPPGRISLVGAGPGDPELLTLRALRIVQGADLVLYDPAIDRRVVDLSRRGARRVEVKGLTPEAIAHLVRTAVGQGDHVVRLVPGDAASDNAADDGLAKTLGLPVEIVPGVAHATKEDGHGA